MLKVILSISGLLFLLNCSSSKKFINPDNDKIIQKFNQDIQGEELFIYNRNGEILAKTDSLIITQDSLFYFTPSSTAVPLSDVNYVNLPPKNSALKILLGFMLIGYGLYYGTASDEDGSFGEALGRAYAGLTMITIGAVATIIVIAVNKDRKYYFNENPDFDVGKGNESPCRNPRFKNRCQ